MIARTFASAALFVATLSPAAGAGESAQEKINAYCAKQWGTDYAMQKDCRRRQTSAALRMLRFIDAHPSGSEEHKILARCDQQWPGDYHMTMNCTDRQVRSYKALKK